MMLMKSDDRTGRTGVGIFVQNDGGKVGVDLDAKYLFDDQLIHGQVGLMQPGALQRADFQVIFREMFLDESGDHGDDLFEHFSSLLDK